MAGAIISPLQDAVELGIGLIMKKAIYMMRGEVSSFIKSADPLLVPNIDWPEQPIDSSPLIFEGVITINARFSFYFNPKIHDSS
jgi:hypothetical protein